MEGETFSTVWLSDVHLGSRACRVSLLLDFLRRTRCETLYLVGDIIDLESLRQSFFWPETHTEVLRLLLKKSQEGTRVVYVPGNHDHDLRALVGVRFGNIEIQRRAVHTTRAGRRLLVLHGDEFDSVIKCSALAAICGAAAYQQPARAEPARALGQRAARPPLLVARAAREVADRQGDALRRQVPARVAARGRRGRVRRRRLRPHPQGRRRRARRPALLQRRRLGRELHRGRRGPARRAAADQLAARSGGRAASV